MKSLSKTLRDVSVEGDSFIVGESIRQYFSRSEVESMLEKREKDSYERGFKDGRLEGHAEGIEEARRESHAAVEERLKVVEGLILDIGSARNKVLTEAQQDILSLSMAVAARLIHKEVAESEIIRQTVVEAIKTASDRQSVKIRLNPQEVGMIESFRKELLEEVRGLKQVELLEDPEIIPGGCIAETPDGSVDARMDRQMEEIRRILMGE